LIDEDVEDALAAVLLGQELAVALRILLIELVLAVVDEPGEVGPIRELKGENRIHVIATNTLKLAHGPSLLTVVSVVLVQRELRFAGCGP
jgi:hypothetical protein